MNVKRKILLICDANLDKAPRVRTSYEALKDKYDFVMAGYKAPPFEDVEYIELPRKKKPKRLNINFHLSWPSPLRKLASVFIKIYLSIFAEKEDKRPLIELYYPLLKDVSCDLIINHHLATLETAVRLKKEKNVKLISNLHEYYPREFEDQEVWTQHEGPRITAICKEFLVQADNVFTVCQGIQEEYLKEFGISSIVVRNDKPFENLEIQKNEGPIRLIHHGAALKSRHLDKIIEAVVPLEGDFELDFMLIPTQEDYYDQIAAMCEKHVHINLVEPVAPEKISRFINTYDAGVYLLDPVNFNSQMALPNKLFEFVQARLAIVVSPNQEMARIVRDFNLGIVSKDYTVASFRKAIQALNRENILDFKQAADQHAMELSSEKNQAQILSCVEELIS